MIKKTGMLLTMIFMIVFLSACKSDDNDYDEIIDQVFEEVQKFNDDEDYLYIHGGREESNTYFYVLEGHEEEGLIIRVYYPYEEKKTGKIGYDEKYYAYEKYQKQIESVTIDEQKNVNLTLVYKEIEIFEN